MNPFNPGSGVPPPYLAGRETHIGTFKKTLASISEGHIENVILYGLRGTGKTVLVEEFNHMCVSNGFLPIKRLQFSRKYCEPVEYAKALKYDIKTLIETFSKIQWLKGKLEAAVTYIKPKSIGIPDIVYYEPSYKRSRNMPFEDYIKSYLSKNWRIFENADHKVIFLFDEFHTVVDIPRDRKYVLSDFLGALNDVQRDGCGYFIVLSGLPNLQLNVKKARSYSERMYKSIEVGNLKPTDAKFAITRPLKNTSWTFEDQLVDSLVTETAGYPYFIQFYCKEIINNVNSNNITLADFERIRSLIIKQLDDDFFNPRIELLSEEERKVLFAMAQTGDENIEFREIARLTKIKRYKLSKYLERLAEKGLAYNYKRGVYRFLIPLLGDFLRRQANK